MKKFLAVLALAAVIAAPVSVSVQTADTIPPGGLAPTLTADTLPPGGLAPIYTADTLPPGGLAPTKA